MQLLADSILILHILFVLAVITPVPLIIIGKYCQWRWVRNFTLRIIHIGMIGFVACESMIGMMCPLTLWENQLRNASGEAGYGESFISYWLHKLLFWNFPSYVFACLYCAFGALIIILWYWARPLRHAASAI